MKYYTSLTILLLTFMTSCRKESIIDEKTYDLSSFSEIEFKNPFDVYLKEDSTFFVRVVADEKILENMIVKVEEGVLKIDNESSLKWLKPKNNKIEVFINSAPLREIRVEETCNIRTVNPITSDEFGLVISTKANQARLELNCNTFYTWNNFSSGGNLTLYGNSEVLKIWNFAIMSVDAKDLSTKTAIVENSSQGDCMINAIDFLEYSIKGIGDIHLYGSPEIVEKQITSSGKLIRH